MKYIFDLDIFLLISIKLSFGEIKMEKDYSQSERLEPLTSILKDPRFAWSNSATYSHMENKVSHNAAIILTSLNSISYAILLTILNTLGIYAEETNSFFSSPKFSELLTTKRALISKTTYCQYWISALFHCVLPFAPSFNCRHLTFTQGFFFKCIPCSYSNFRTDFTSQKWFTTHRSGKVFF